MAGNQVGKTYSAGMEIAMHATGYYPDWWTGRRFDRPVLIWTGSETNESSREIIQAVLLGTEEAYIAHPDMGTGTIPHDRILKLTTRQAGVKDVVDQIIVKHPKGRSRIALKTYDQGRKKWMGKGVDVVWPDEEPPEDIYSEALTRTQKTGGMVMMTFTPWEGSTKVVERFQSKEGQELRHLTGMSIHDAEHYTDTERETIIANYEDYERDTRAYGIVMRGSGRVFPLSDGEIKCDPFTIERHFRRIAGVDFGIDHPAAGVQCAYDEDKDIFYITDVYRKKEETPIYHAAWFKAQDPQNFIPVAWPHDGLQRGKDSGRPLWKMYRQHGVRMMSRSARFEDEIGGGQSTAAIALAMLERMKTGRFKVFSTCADFFEEFRFYHRKDGKIVPLKDDILMASMYALMELRHMRVFIQQRRRSAPMQPIVGGPL